MSRESDSTRPSISLRPGFLALVWVPVQVALLAGRASRNAMSIDTAELARATGLQTPSHPHVVVGIEAKDLRRLPIDPDPTSQVRARLSAVKALAADRWLPTRIRAWRESLSCLAGGGSRRPEESLVAAFKRLVGDHRGLSV